MPPDNTSRAAPAQPSSEIGDAPIANTSSAMAVSFLREFDPAGWHNVVAITPEGSSVEGWTFPPGQWERIRAVIEPRLLTHNLYFSLNEPRAGAPNKKLAKSDIESIRTISVDLDPADGDLEQQRALLLDRLQAAVKEKLPPPSFVVDSGAGYHAHWVLNEKVPVEKLGAWAEDQARAFAAEVGGDNTHNLDRILRLPGTMNLPGPSKLSKGRVARPTSVRHRGADRYKPMQLSNAVAPIADRHSGNDAVDPESLRSRIAEAQEEIDGSGFDTVASLDDLDVELHAKFSADLARLPQLAELWEGRLEGTDQTASAFRLRLAQILGRLMTYDAASFAAIAHAWPYAHGRNALTPRSLARDWVNIGETFVRRLDELGIQPIDGGEQKAAGVASEKSAPAGITWANPLDWEGRPILPQRWDVKGWVPTGEVTLLYGDGGIGKTLAVHQLAVSVAAGVPWLGQQTTRGRVMCFFCEDSEDVLMRRHRDILANAGVTNADVGSNLRIAARKYGDNILALWDRNTGAMKRQAVWELLKNDALEFGANLLIVDTIADTFGGNEIDRGQVNAFIKSVLGRLAAEINGTVVALGHPSVAGKASGSGTSGSTAWSNAVRSRLYLRYPKGVEKGNIRELEGMKANYGAKGNLLKLRWHKGAFDVVAASLQPLDDGSSVSTLAPLDRPIANIEDAADLAVFDAVQAHPSVVMSLKSSSANFAPRILKMREPDILLPFGRDEIEASILRLIDRGAIVEAEVGRDRAHRAQIGLAAVADNAPGLAAAVASSATAARPGVFN